MGHSSVCLGVDHHQKAPERVQPDRDEALLGMVVGIGYGAGQVVVEDLHGVLGPTEQCCFKPLASTGIAA